MRAIQEADGNTLNVWCQPIVDSFFALYQLEKGGKSYELMKWTEGPDKGYVVPGGESFYHESPITVNQDFHGQVIAVLLDLNTTDEMVRCYRTKLWIPNGNMDRKRREEDAAAAEKRRKSEEATEREQAATNAKKATEIGQKKTTDRTVRARTQWHVGDSSD